MYNARIIAAVGQDKKLRLHDLDEIKVDRGAPVIKQPGILRISTNNDNISQPHDVVNKDFSLRYDDTAFDPLRELPNALLELAQNEKERNTLLRYKENADMLFEKRKFAVVRAAQAAQGRGRKAGDPGAREVAVTCPVVPDGAGWRRAVKQCILGRYKPATGRSN